MTLPMAMPVTVPAAQRPSHAAPPVVAVMVVHEPGEWFAETLASLAAQDYPDLRLVALLTSTTPATVADAIQVAVPAALVRIVEGNPGFGPVANQAMAVVDGHDGFLLFVHDDVALQPDVVSQLVAEAFRSNAAMVGPKLVEWDTPSVLQHVGLDADRTGRLVDVVDPGERDQQQHDAVRDTFALPSACMLVRNDIFREVGGFAAQIPFLGEERDVCWRLHMLGARVMVNPAAVVRHRGAFATRATLIEADARAERNRVRTVVTCAPLSQLPLVIVRLLVQSIVDTVLGLLNGEQQRGLASLRAVFALVIDAPMIVARRRDLRPLRRVPGSEVSSLQLRASARLAVYARHRRALREQNTSEIPAIVGSVAPPSRVVTLVGLAAVLLMFIGSRGLIVNGVGNIGQFVPLAAEQLSVVDLVRVYFVGWAPG
ncbi:MAG: glycosyltransferase, partial [Ilumatobacteraceae bacterium]|nr:glycosyltransferase [Ilumatobacteraceae bacterium]